MANDTQITLLGNLTADPEVRFIPSGAAVANFTVASTPRQFDKNSNEWKDGETLFMRCSVWREQAENVGESLKKGMAVIVQGTLKSRSYEKDGQNRTVTELEVIEVGPSLRKATANITKGGVSGGGQQGGGNFQQQPQQAPQGNQWGQQPQQWGNQPQGQWPQQGQQANAPF